MIYLFIFFKEKKENCVFSESGYLLKLLEYIKWKWKTGRLKQNKQRSWRLGVFLRNMCLKLYFMNIMSESWTKPPALSWRRSNRLACWQSTKQNSGSTGHLHDAPVCCSRSTEGQKTGLFCRLCKTCLVFVSGTDYRLIFKKTFFYNRN